MRLVVVVALLALVAPARADVVDVGLMTATARQLAREHNCPEVQTLGANVRALDAGYYAAVFAVDPDIAACLAPPPSEAPVTLAFSPLPPMPPTGRRKSPAVALELSLGVTLAAIPLYSLTPSTGRAEGAMLGLAAAALLVGPSVGHYYAGSWSWWLPPRLVGAGLLLGGGYAALESIGCASPDPCRRYTVLSSMLWPGLVLTLMSIAGDIATAPSAAHRYNRAHGWEPAVEPIAVPGGAGVGVVGAF
jgi:hypothetical protein